MCEIKEPIYSFVNYLFIVSSWLNYESCSQDQYVCTSIWCSGNYIIVLNYVHNWCDQKVCSKLNYVLLAYSTREDFEVTWLRRFVKFKGEVCWFSTNWYLLVSPPWNERYALIATDEMILQWQSFFILYSHKTCTCCTLLALMMLCKRNKQKQKQTWETRKQCMHTWVIKFENL